MKLRSRISFTGGETLGTERDLTKEQIAKVKKAGLENRLVKPLKKVKEIEEKVEEVTDK
jgi:hypothetical protein